MQIVEISIPYFPPFKNLSLTFDQNVKPQVFPIMGDNASGKTMLLNLIFGLFNEQEWVKL